MFSSTRTGANQSNTLPIQSFEMAGRDTCTDTLSRLEQDLKQFKANRNQSLDFSKTLQLHHFGEHRRKDRPCTKVCQILAKTLLLNNPDIKTVTFRGCYLSREARASILHALADGAPNLERIDLTLPRFALRTELAKNELAGLQAMFEQCPKLQTVKLEHQTSKMQGRINQLAQTVNTNASVEFNLFWPKPAVASRRAQNVQAQEPPALSPEQIAIEIDLDPLTCLTELQAERFATGPKQI